MGFVKQMPDVHNVHWCRLALMPSDDWFILAVILFIIFAVDSPLVALSLGFLQAKFAACTFQYGFTNTTHACRKLSL